MFTRPWMVGAALLATLLTTLPAAAQPRPIIERIEPTSGPAGSQLQIVGRQLGTYSRVFLGEQELQVLRRLPNRWTVQVPAGATSGQIIIHTAAGAFAGPFFRVTMARPGPVITGLQPAQGPAGSEVTILGQNFSARLSDNYVMLAGRPVVVRSATPTTIRVIVPEGSAGGSFSVRVGTAGEAMSPPFAIIAGTSITTLTPEMGPPGANITITGTGFSPRVRSNRVFINGARVRVLSASPGQLMVRLPRRMTSGPIMVDVNGLGRATSPRPYIVQLAPSIRRMNPRQGAPGQVVTLSGANFGVDPRVVTVSLGGRPVVIRRITGNELDVEVPPGTPSGRFVVRVHQAEATSRRDFQVLTPIAIHSFAPQSGGPGTVVTILGMGFDPNPRRNQVLLSGVQGQIVAAAPNQLRVRMPAAASGPIEVRVNGAGSALSSSAFMTTTPPFVANFAPRQGGVGTLVTIRGNNFGNNPSLVRVELGQVPMQVQSVTDQQIVAIVPRGANSARISVTVGMQGGTVSGTDFRVEANRQVLSTSPTMGQRGTQVVIQGQRFPRRGVMVQFAGTAAVPAQRLNRSQLRVTVPPGAQSGLVNVLLPGGRVMPAGTFTVTAAPPTVTTVAPPQGGALHIQSMQPRCLRPGCVVVLRGAGFSTSGPQNRVRFGGRGARVTHSTPNELHVTIPNVRGTHQFIVTVRNVGETRSNPVTVR